MFSSIKGQANSYLSNFLHKLPTNIQQRHDKDLSQNTWPNLIKLENIGHHLSDINPFRKPNKPTLSKEQNDILDRFIKIIEENQENQIEVIRPVHHAAYDRRRTDREEIRKKLAMGTDEEAFNDASIKKPSLQSRLQNGKNLQICFMNETASDCESQCSDTESTQDRIDEIEGNLGFKDTSKMTESECQTMDFMAQQAKLQAEARLALSQAKEMARMQMEIEKQNQRKSPITEIIKDSFNKIGFPFPAGKRRMSRQLLTDMNVAQLQVIVNDLHTQIENLNEDLVQLLLTRDDLHMEQDSMLVDIEDLTKHLGAKQRPNATLCTSSTNYAIGSNSTTNNLRFSASIIPSKSLKLRPTIVKK
ncbi:Schwannomin-interacting protein 1 [Armadillidium vulgare]|nr:Schwannomin-interacting protein 1 [Armadillidium vulgare]